MVEGVLNHCLGEDEARVLTALHRGFCSADFDLDTFDPRPGLLNSPETEREP
jgi:hypothetical protein